MSSFFEILALEANFAFGGKFLDPILVSTKVLDFVKGLTVFPKSGSKRLSTHDDADHYDTRFKYTRKIHHISKSDRQNEPDFYRALFEQILLEELSIF